MSTQRYSPEFISIGCNRVSNCVSWGRNNLVAYAAGNYIGIYDPLKIKLLHTIHGHTARVNSVAWIPPSNTEMASGIEEETEIVSASVDKTIRIWSKKGNKFENKAILKGHQDSCTTISVFRSDKDDSLTIVSTSVDGTLKIWKRKDSLSEWILSQDIDFGSSLIEALDISSLPGSHTQIIAFGTVDNHVKIYLENESNQFEQIASLSGHEDWIRTLAFVKTNEGDLLLASGSQDKRIRLWRINEVTGKTTENRPQKLDPTQLLSQLYELDDGDVINLSQHGTTFQDQGKWWNITLESVILGHEDRVYSVQWLPFSRNSENKITQTLRLLSASMDRTMVVWEPDPETGVWIEAARVGEIGGNHLGFFGCAFGKDGQYILGHTYNGAFQLWKRESFENGNENWTPQPTISGHFDQVMDISWDSTKTYFVSVSKDQSARLWSLWKQSNMPSTTSEDDTISQWHEIARPQVHGHDLSCIAFQNGVLHRFISGAEEKVLRVFDGPKSFLESLKNLSIVGYSQTEFDSRADAANVPALGLSNKPIFEERESEKNMAETVYDEIHNGGGYGGDFQKDEDMHKPLILDYRPPVETELRQRLMWPETHKLYGHGNELICVASNNNGDLIASSCACKTQNQYQAGIRIWDTKDWKEVNELSGHSLTVTTLEFSHNDRYLVSGSRGRSLCIHERTNPQTFEFTSVFSNAKAHLRIIWSASWSHDDKYIATGSRDKSVKIWEINDHDNQFKCKNVETLKFNESVTSVSWSPAIINGKSNQLETKYILAIGFEDGAIEIWSYNALDNQWQCYVKFEAEDSHVETVRKLSWGKPKEDGIIPLLTCSTDNSIRLYNVQFQ